MTLIVDNTYEEVHALREKAANLIHEFEKYGDSIPGSELDEWLEIHKQIEEKEKCISFYTS